jgi:hypothetical protein
MLVDLDSVVILTMALYILILHSLELIFYSGESKLGIIFFINNIYIIIMSREGKRLFVVWFITYPLLVMVLFIVIALH